MTDIWLRSIRDMLAATFFLGLGVSASSYAVYLHDWCSRTHSKPGIPIIPFFYLVGLIALGAGLRFLVLALYLPWEAAAAVPDERPPSEEEAEKDRRYAESMAKYNASKSTH